MRPSRIDLGLHPAPIELDDGLPILEVVDIFRALQVFELREVYLVDRGFVEKIVDDFSLSVICVEALSKGEHVQGIAFEIAKLRVEVRPRQILGSVAVRSRLFLTRRQCLLRRFLLVGLMICQLKKLSILAESKISPGRPAFLAGFIQKFANSQIQDQSFHGVFVHEVHRNLQEMTQVVGNLFFIDAKFLVDLRKIEVINLRTLGVSDYSAFFVDFIGIACKLRKNSAIPHHIYFSLVGRDKEFPQNFRVKYGLVFASVEHALNGTNNLVSELPQESVPLDLNGLKLLCGPRTSIYNIKRRLLLARNPLGPVFNGFRLT